MKKEIISAVTALTTAFAGMTATTAAADISDSMIYSPPSWGSITTNLSISEMEPVNGGSAIAITACVVGVAAAAIKVADLVYDCVKGK